MAQKLQKNVGDNDDDNNNNNNNTRWFW